MKSLLLLAFIIIPFEFINAQTDIYSASGYERGKLIYSIGNAGGNGNKIYSSDGKLAYFIERGKTPENMKLYYADGNFIGKLAAIIEDNNIYNVDGNSKENLRMICENNYAYYADGNDKGKVAFIVDGDIVYYRDKNYKQTQIATIYGGISYAILFVLLDNKHY